MNTDAIASLSDQLTKVMQEIEVLKRKYNSIIFVISLHRSRNIEAYFAFYFLVMTAALVFQES